MSGGDFEALEAAAHSAETALSRLGYTPLSSDIASLAAGMLIAAAIDRSTAALDRATKALKDGPSG